MNQVYNPIVEGSAKEQTMSYFFPQRMEQIDTASHALPSLRGCEGAISFDDLCGRSSDFDTVYAKIYQDLCSSATGNVTLNTETALRSLSMWDVHLGNVDEIRDYLTRYPDTVDAVLCLVSESIKRIGQLAEYSLELYHDPEIDDEYLTVYVRQDEYAGDIMDQIRAASAKCEQLLNGSQGWVLLTTDFRSPGVTK